MQGQRRGEAIRTIRLPASADVLREYATIPISFEVRSRYKVEGPESGPWRLVEVPEATPWVKDYDAERGEGPTRWAAFDLTNWTVTRAYEGDLLVGGAVIARDTPGVDLLEGRRDLAHLWDLRVHPDHRRKGFGALLIQDAAVLARSKGCRELRIETQNINVPACRLYARLGFELKTVRKGAYPSLPQEIQLIWARSI